MSETTTTEQLREQVRERYAAAAITVTSGQGTASCCDDAFGDGGSCCGPTVLEVDDTFGSALYAATDRDSLPVSAVAASLGCGNPIAVAELRHGEKVLDLGSGGGIDVLLSARRVGQTGFAYGVDMTDEMLDLARANAAQAGATNVEFLKGTIEDIPLPDESVDVVISNCVINLSVDKPKVITEIFRVLSPGGRIGISDVVAEDHLSVEARAELGSYVGCIAGALSRQEYLDGLSSAGFINPSVRFTHQAADGMHSAIIQAVKPSTMHPASTIADPSIRARPVSPEMGTTASAKPKVSQSEATTLLAETQAMVESCCDHGTAGVCCTAEVKSSCCGDTTAGHPGTCGCR
jgi:arsenite methyltransferase